MQESLILVSKRATTRWPTSSSICLSILPYVACTDAIVRQRSCLIDDVLNGAAVKRRQYSRDLEKGWKMVRQAEFPVARPKV
ncbi:hypothetical protein HZH66_005753 [Vespula vulgaris]|uniref:Uncharacterized protein n=1 Tax=Vespula vulgaris TaxID=7454 RepID=A0A834K508_VESVU|nr:hypothetical protein HZH66_005753 [Vespula vulgaris]